MDETAADRYRRLSDIVTGRIGAVPPDAWDAPTPCTEWTVRALVAHLVQGHGRFQSLVGREPVEHAFVDDDPLGAWDAVRRQMQADLDDPERFGEEYDGGLGRARWGDSVDGFIGFDLVVHGWDLARATGQDETIDPQDVQRLTVQVERMGDVMRSNGVIAAPREPAPDASAQDRLLAALGR
jgi:uncharacterized protein (TIGR03086 family)